LDSLTNQITRVERNSNILIESLSLLIRYTLTVTAPVGQLSDEERKLGRDRFEEFAERVAQQLATGRRTLGGDEDDE
ncbi:MAG TPA: CopG family transcriptional regulator, partial [Sphingomicrobium sp.]|nr:CopG family transcriptional regulator [Sphingomicrobium sp.]